MKVALTAAAAVAVMGLASGTASAQPAVLVPHRGHYHVVPAYSPPVYGGFGYSNFSPGYSFGGNYSSFGLNFGGSYSSPSFGYGNFYSRPSPYYGSYGRGGHHHHHHGHGHR